jgi:glycosyltransferase involved in cell wall biosynthesis
MSTAPRPLPNVPGGPPPAAAASRRPLVSIIAPVYNEEAVIEEFLSRVVGAIAGLKERYDFEILLVDDGSRDRSLAVMKRFSRFDRRVRVLELRRNYGQTPALQAGLDAARGDIFITMDSDLQHFPEEIPHFLDRLEAGYDCVCGWRHQRQEGVVRRWPSRVANYFLRRISGLDIHDFGTTYRSYRADIARNLRLFGEFHRFVPVLCHLEGGKIGEIPIRNIERPRGKSNYGLGRTLGVFFDLFLLHFLVRYLDRPLRAFGKVALACFAGGSTILAVLVACAYLLGYATFREHSGWFILGVMLILTSVQVLLAGILAELLIRVHFALGDRRVYHLRHEWNADNVGL